MGIIITEDNYEEVLQALNKYEYSLKASRDWNNIITTAERKAKQSEKENTALTMLHENEPIEKIIRYTRLSEAQIIELKNNIINQQ